MPASRQNNTSWRPQSCQECTCYGDVAICGPTHCPNPHCDLQRVRYFTFDKYALFLFVPCNYYVQVSNQSVYLVMLPNVVCYMAAFASGFWVMAHLY